MGRSNVTPGRVVLCVLAVVFLVLLYWQALSEGPEGERRGDLATPIPADQDLSTTPRDELERIRRAVSPDGLLATHLDYYRRQVGRYPRNLREIAEPPDPSIQKSGWRGPYLGNPALLQDPWGRQYYYAAPGRHNTSGYDLWSAGVDGISGTADDIGNW